jgi:hypothetical protein
MIVGSGAKPGTMGFLYMLTIAGLRDARIVKMKWFSKST